jgi:hypothetical protein
LIAGAMSRKSLPAINGAASSAHRLKCVRYSSFDIRPLPTSSMSGSFQWPGPAKRASGPCENPIADMRSQLSLMSSDVRHRLPPASGAHSATLARPYWQMLNTSRRVTRCSASPMRWYTARMSESSRQIRPALHQSYFR